MGILGAVVTASRRLGSVVMHGVASGASRPAWAASVRQHERVPDDEQRLAGGNTSVVVRVGDTVRRSSGPWTPVVQDLLGHVRAQGFELAPEPLGVDDAGREVLRFVPGDTVGATQPWPAWVWSDDLLAEAGQAARRYHDAVASFRPSGLVPWRAGPAALGDGEIVCHNDFAPYNVVSVGGRLCALFDWDFAAPGTPLWEVAFMAWHWAPLHHPALAESLGWSEPDRLHGRLRLLCDSYGLDDRSGLVDEIVRRIRSSRDGIVHGAAAGDDVFVRLEAGGHAEEMAKTLRHVETIAEALRRALHAP